MLLKNDKMEQYHSAFSLIEENKSEHTKNEPNTAKLKSALQGVVEKELGLKSDYRAFIANEKNKIICPECSFEIKDALPFTSDSLKKDLQNILAEKNKVEARYEKSFAKQSVLIEVINSLPRLKTNQSHLQREIDDTEDSISSTKEWEEVFIDYTELKKSEKEFEETKVELIKIKTDLNDVAELEEMISDKNLKGIILNQQLPFLNKYINEFLELFESKFNFVIDNNFNENVISRNADNEFNSLSNGQKQRISLSILFSFLKLIEEKNGVSTNLLILDEYLDSSLDIEGINEVMAILDEVFSETKNIILISHNPDIKNRVELLNRIVKIDLENGFSKMEITE